MPRPKLVEITKCQSETLEAICNYIDANGYPPTVKELADIFEVSGPSIHDRLNQLVRKGYLSRSSKKARGITLTNRPQNVAIDLVSIPLVGYVAAGSPSIAWENALGEVLVPKTLTSGSKCFALTIKGDSMIDAGIQDGNTIVVRRQALAENGDIVVAMIDDEATVKRLKINSDTIELIPENPKYKPIQVSPDDNFRIVGKVVANRH